MGRKRWKEESGCHTRSRIEVICVQAQDDTGREHTKQGMAKTDNRVKTQYKILNRMLYLGMPESYKVA